MTGWRIGWLSAPPALGQVIENLIQYSTSGVAAFMQRAATVALDEGDDFIADPGRARPHAAATSSATGWPRPAASASPNRRAPSTSSSRSTANRTREKLGLKLVDEANIGIAPGDAFGEAGRGFLRLCFLRSAEQMEEATRRLVNWLRRR